VDDQQIVFTEFKLDANLGFVFARIYEFLSRLPWQLQNGWVCSTQ